MVKASHVTYYLKPLEESGEVVLTARALLCNKLGTHSGYKAGTFFFFFSFFYSTEPLGASLLTLSATLQPLYKWKITGKMDQQVRLLLVKDPSSLSGTKMVVRRVPTAKSYPLTSIQVSWHVHACIILKN